MRKNREKRHWKGEKKRSNVKTQRKKKRIKY